MLASQPQDDFSAGIYRGRKAPQNSLYDAVNALINDEGLLYRRGGSEYYSASNAAISPTYLHAIFLQPVDANRIIGKASGSSAGFVLDGSLAPVAFSASAANHWSRAASVGDYAIWTNTGTSIVYYGGSLKSANYTTGTLTATDGSTAVTGAGTSWLANVDAGMILTAANGIGVVKSVNSDTSITLASNWFGGSVVTSAYTARVIYSPSYGNIGGYTGRTYVCAAGAGSPRLLFCRRGNRVYFTSRGNPLDFSADNYHELPANVNIIGAEGQGDSALIFTTGGIYQISNLSFDPIDAFGNIQHTIEQVNKDLILWEDFGIAAWAGGLVVPCVDDVYLMAPGVLQPITANIRPLYRSYVKAGYQTGQAAVHRGHYHLPILNGSTLVDVLVCRLDRGQAWTRWAGHSAGSAYALLTGDTTRQPVLLGVSGARVLDLSGAYDPATTNAVEADGTTSDCVITTRDYPTGGNQQGFVQRARVRYELTDDGSGATAAPTVALAYSSDADAGVFTTLTEKGEQGGAAGWGVSDGSKYQWALVGKRRERIRFRITVAGACAAFVLRSIELLLRPTGKQ